MSEDQTQSPNREGKAKTTRLTYKQQRLIEELASGKHKSQGAAARAAGVHPVTASRALSDAHVVAKLALARQTQADKAKGIANRALDIVHHKLARPDDVTIGEAAGVAKVATEIYDKTDDGEQLERASYSQEWWKAWLRRGLLLAYKAGLRAQDVVLSPLDNPPQQESMAGNGPSVDIKAVISHDNAKAGSMNSHDSNQQLPDGPEHPGEAPNGP